MKLKNKKKYKAIEPGRTINNIRNILFENGIIIKEIHHDSDVEGLKSCSLRIVNNGISFLELGTNGKGMSFEYSLASAYGEFMERLQNDSLIQTYSIVYPEKSNISSFEKNKPLLEIIEKNGYIKDFSLSPDEVILSKKEIINSFGSTLRKILDLKEDQNLEQIIDAIAIFDNNRKNICLPFFNAITKKIELLPFQLVLKLCGSNGMCAGNNKKEAFIQGVCEIFERYAIKKIYIDNVELPDIPKEQFVGQRIFEILNDIEKNMDYSVTIKDCSCGIGLPVIGVLIINKINQTYTFHLGSDTNPIIALERCITELYQGSNKSIYKKFNSLEDKNIDFTSRKIENEYDLDEDYLTRLELFKTVTDGSGRWPKYIFEENKNFTSFSSNDSSNDDDDIKYLLNIVVKNGFEVFIRDVSHFGFPSLFVYIPGMSEMAIDTVQALKNSSYYNVDYNVLLNLKNATKEDIKKLVFVLNEKYNYSPKNKPNIKNIFSFIHNADLLELTLELFIFMLYYRVEDLEKAYYFLKKHIDLMNENEEDTDLYLICVLDYINLKRQGYDFDKIQEIIAKYHSTHIFEEVLKDFKNPVDVFNHFKLPACFDCKNCPLIDNCNYLHIIEFMSKTKDVKFASKVDQHELITAICN